MPFLWWWWWWRWATFRMIFLLLWLLFHLLLPFSCSPATFFRICMRLPNLAGMNDRKKEAKGVHKVWGKCSLFFYQTHKKCTHYIYDGANNIFHNKKKKVSLDGKREQHWNNNYHRRKTSLEGVCLFCVIPCQCWFSSEYAVLLTYAHNYVVTIMVIPRQLFDFLQGKINLCSRSIMNFTEIQIVLNNNKDGKNSREFSLWRLPATTSTTIVEIIYY